MIYKRLKSICDERNVSIYALEKATGLSKGSIIKWENSSPKIENVERIADYFNVSVDYLLGREEKSVIERPTNALTENFVNEFSDIIADENYIKFSKLYKVINELQRQYIVSYSIGWLDKSGVDTAKVIGY